MLTDQQTALIQYIFQRLSEASTIRGLVLTISSLMGLTISPTNTDNIIFVVIGLVGILGTILPDNLTKKPNTGVEDK